MLVLAARLSAGGRIARLFQDPDRYLVSGLQVADIDPVDVLLLRLAGLEPRETEAQLVRTTTHLRRDAGQDGGEDALLDSAGTKPLTIPVRQKRDHGRSPCGPQNTEISGEPPFWPWLVRFISLFDSAFT
jgi:hypothetical protein